MKKRRLFWLLWLAVTGCLYFFENSTATRVIFAASLTVPLCSLFCALWCADRVKFSLILPPTVRNGEPFELRMKASGPFLLAGCIPLSGIRAEDSVSGAVFEENPLAVDRERRVRLLCTQAGELTVSLAETAVEDCFGLWHFPVIAPPAQNLLFSADCKPDHREESDLTAWSGVREYVPGDPIRLIHWKLTAKTDRVMIRETERDEIIEQLQDKGTAPGTVLAVSVGKGAEKRISYRKVSGFVLMAALLLLIPIPEARYGTGELLNRLFSASEAANAYAYEHLQIPSGQSVTRAVILLTVGGFSFLVLTVCSAKPMILLSAALLAGAQAYFGLTLPVWLNLSLFGLFGYLLMRSRGTFPRTLFFIAAVLLTAVLIRSQYAGTDLWIEARSEMLRDRLAWTTVSAEGSAVSQSDLPTETRHVNTRALITGEGSAVTAESFRLLTEGEEQISLPELLRSLGALLPILAGGAAGILLLILMIRVFIRRGKAAAARRVFDSADTSASVCAMFRHTADWLDSFGYGSGDLPFREWSGNLKENLPESYVNSFDGCVPVFEQAFYSEHAPDAEGRARVSALLNDTEALLYQRAGLMKRLRLKYVECLHR